MARCNDCNKFCSLEPGEPDASLDVERIDATHVRVVGSIELALTCAECGSEVLQTTWDVEFEVHNDELAEHVAAEPAEPAEHQEQAEPAEDETAEDETAEDEQDEHELSLEDEDVSGTSVTVGKGSRARTAYGVEFTARIVCSCDEPLSVDVEWNTDAREASEFDEY